VALRKALAWKDTAAIDTATKALEAAKEVLTTKNTALTEANEKKDETAVSEAKAECKRGKK